MDALSVIAALRLSHTLSSKTTTSSLIANVISPGELAMFGYSMLLVGLFGTFCGFCFLKGIYKREGLQRDKWDSYLAYSLLTFIFLLVSFLGVAAFWFLF